MKWNRNQPGYTKDWRPPANYLNHVRRAVEQKHHCRAVHRNSFSVLEMCCGETEWEGVVEHFDLIRHPKAKGAYAWLQLKGKDGKGQRLIVVLEHPHMLSPQEAVGVYLAHEVDHS